MLEEKEKTRKILQKLKKIVEGFEKHSMEKQGKILEKVEECRLKE